MKVKKIILMSIIFFIIYFLGKNNFAQAATYVQSVQTGISAFPASYQTRLKELAAAHPTWIFQAYNTGVSWDELIAMERNENVHKNRVPYNSPESWKNSCGFTEGGWSCASDAIVKYYLNPRNFLNETQIFQFIETSYNADIQTVDVIKKSVSGTFLDKTITCKNFYGNNVTMSYAEIIVEAARQSNISAFYIKSKIIQEVSSRNGPQYGSDSVTGTYSGYAGYYNFFNYGAYDSGDPIANGLQFAKEQGWDSPYKAIVGGAKLIGTKYINQGQNTAYFNKWDVVGTSILKSGQTQTVSSNDMFVHQYMTNIMDPTSQSYSTYKLYKDVLNSKITFIIPVYNNMPSSVSMPQDIPVKSISLNKTELILGIDDKDKLTVNYNPSNATLKSSTWESSDSSIVRVYNGEIRGLRTGTATITATSEDGGNRATCKVTVIVPVESISLDKTELVLGINEKDKLTVTYNPSNCGLKSSIWESLDPNIVRVYNGEIRGLKAGTTMITAISENRGKKANCKVTVRDSNTVPVQSISLNKTEITLGIDEKDKLTVNYNPSNATLKSSIWESSDSSIVRVYNGEIRGLKEGVATITAKSEDGWEMATCKVTVKTTNASVQSITLDKTEITLGIDEKDKLTVNYNPNNAAIKSSIWKSSDSSIVRVYNGEIRGLKEGTATITAISEDGAKTATCKVNVKTSNISVRSISLDKTKIELKIDEKDKLTVIYNPSNATLKSSTWESSDSNIVRVYNGEIRGLKGGKATITAISEDGKKKATCEVTVVVPVKSISLDKTEITLGIDEKDKLTVNYNPSNATLKSSIWESSDSSVVRVYNGEIRGLKEGTATITAKSEDGEKIAICKVTVK